MSSRAARVPLLPLPFEGHISNDPKMNLLGWQNTLVPIAGGRAELALLSAVQMGRQARGSGGTGPPARRPALPWALIPAVALFLGPEP